MTLNATNYSISKSLFEKLANAFKSAVKFIHRRGGYKAEYLKEEEVKPLIEHTYEAFSEAVDFGVKDNVIPEAMKMYLKNNTFVFSGFKTHQQLERVSRLLHDDDGHIKPFNRFLKDVQSINKKYNRTYLQAEYNFAVASAQSAGKWHEFSQYADRYYLQYRTAKDERVREEHAILDGITLPFDDKFWDEFFPPNGWNCRCEAIQVSKKRYEPSNPSEALARGRSATYKPNADGVNKAAIFRFNPGKEQRIFPKKHPYFPKGCGDCGLNQYAVGSQSPATCIACKDIYKMLRKRKKKEIVNDSTLHNKTFNIKEIRINNTLKFDKHSLKRYVGEAQSLDELNLVYEIYNGNVKFEFLRTEPINMSKANAKDKIKRKVRDYSVYRVKVNGMQYILYIENYKDVYEQLYGIKTLKKGDDDYD